jgi:hypothetical protein
MNKALLHDGDGCKWYNNWGQVTVPMNPDNKIRLETSIGKVVQSAYPELVKAKAEISTFAFEQEDVFLRSLPGFGYFIGRESYLIGINPTIFRQNISDEALEGILAHELAHISVHPRIRKTL